MRILPKNNSKAFGSQRLAYHVVLHAIEARAGISPLARFWLALRHAANAHLPYERYHRAGLERARERASTGWIERSVADWMSTDLNPAVQATRLAASVADIVAGYNAYNASADLRVRTQAVAEGDEAKVCGRQVLGGHVDPEPCKLATYAAIHRIVAEARSRAAAGGAADALTISRVASLLGVEGSASAQAAAVFEARGSVPIPELARELGCGQRTLERRLKEEGGSAEAIRISARMVAATRMLPSQMTLTEIAFEAGFSDAAHMARSFKAACGLPPARLRESLRLGGRSARPSSARGAR